MWSASASTSMALEPTTATSGDSGHSEDEARKESQRRDESHSNSARNTGPASPSPLVPALDMAAGGEGETEGLRRRHQSTLPNDTLHDFSLSHTHDAPHHTC